MKNINQGLFASSFRLCEASIVSSWYTTIPFVQIFGRLLDPSKPTNTNHEVSLGDIAELLFHYISTYDITTTVYMAQALGQIYHITILNGSAIQKEKGIYIA
jgi:hypothetical protein